MEPRKVLMAGAAFAVLGVVLGFVGSFLEQDPVFRGSPELGLMRFATGMTGMVGFLLLAWGVYQLSGVARVPPMLLAGLAVVLVSRLASNLLSLAIGLQLLLSGQGLGFFFSLFGTAGGLGTVLVFIGLFDAFAQRLGLAAPRPAPAAAPAAAAPPAAGTTAAAAPARRSSFRPPQAPFPASKPAGSAKPETAQR